ncbi:hypothetical protein B0H11DRAFT_2005227 [Mycena galericulata]|nr:hypothetical protein B0H11DRAFT_2005227 [Mycena galericulata]
MSDAQRYSRLLLQQRYGFPLWNPKPCDDLPEPARRSGTQIGDVGVVNQDGSFDAIFNILYPQGDYANRFGVPPGFEMVLLEAGDIRTRTSLHPPNSDIWSTNVDSETRFFNNVFNDLAGGISTNLNQSALLHLPDGASTWDLRPQQVFRDYALKHGQNWYAFVNDDLRRMVGTSSLYLVTGVTKSTSWSIGVVDDSSRGKISLKPEGGQTRGATASFAWELGNTSSSIHSGPHRNPGEESWRDNQTVFIRGFKVAVRSDSDVDYEDDEWLDDYVSNIYHPSDVINQHILDSVPSAAVAVTHDDEWISGLSNEGDNMVLDDKELLRRISDKFPIDASGGLQACVDLTRVSVDHKAIVAPLPTDTRLSTVLDTCHSHSLLDLEHHRRNRGPVPSTWSGKRQNERIRNRNARRDSRGPYITLRWTSSEYLGSRNMKEMDCDLSRMVLGDFEKKGGDHWNALQAAYHVGHTDIVRLLLQKGADVCARDALAAYTTGDPALARPILEKAVDGNADVRCLLIEKDVEAHAFKHARDTRRLDSGQMDL